MIKIVIIIVLKLNSRVEGHGSGWLELTWVNVKIKVVIIIVLKLNSGVDSRQDSSQHKKKWLLS